MSLSFRENLITYLMPSCSRDEQIESRPMCAWVKEPRRILMTWRWRSLMHTFVGRRDCSRRWCGPPASKGILTLSCVSKHHRTFLSSNFSMILVHCITSPIPSSDINFWHYWNVHSSKQGRKWDGFDWWCRISRNKAKLTPMYEIWCARSRTLPSSRYRNDEIEWRRKIYVVAYS